MIIEEAYYKICLEDINPLNLENIAITLHAFINNRDPEFVRPIKVQDLLFTNSNAKMHFNLNLEEFAYFIEHEVAQGKILDNQTYYYTTSIDHYFEASSLTPKGLNIKEGLNSELVNEVVKYFFKVFPNFDWLSSIGSAPAGMTAKVIKNGDTYYLDLKYSVYDLADTPEQTYGDEERLSRKLVSVTPYYMHRLGEGRFHFAYGVEEYKVNWQNGDLNSINSNLK